MYKRQGYAGSEQQDYQRRLAEEGRDADWQNLQRYNEALGLGRGVNPTTSETEKKKLSTYEKIIGGISAIGSFFAEGGEVPGYADGGMIPQGPDMGWQKKEGRYQLVPRNTPQPPAPQPPTPEPVRQQASIPRGFAGGGKVRSGWM